ncbi:hypothetical protein AAF712_006340 [Marasmius tenuissimus]|uniref:Uncharacterized protein n=1 Tax=Marasmius tenuissimus TaxID=585030 RepID=A0ABR2ZYT6_9AGAR
MHASLAYLSTETRTLDAIIAHRPTHTPTLPTEILLLIRSRLLLTVTTHLIHQSHSALRRYENTLRHLLCPECRSYNEYVYGDDPWKWEPCGSCGLNLKFIDRREWLENYLSRKSLRFVSREGPPRSHHPIWRLVGDVLHGFQCKWALGNGNGNVLIVPDRDPPGVLLDDKLRLGRVERELALTVTVPCVERGTSMRPVSSPDPMGRSSGVYRTVTVFPVLCGVIFSIPLSLVTLLLKVVCWYCKPGAFKCVLL